MGRDEMGSAWFRCWFVAGTDAFASGVCCAAPYVEVSVNVAHHGRVCMYIHTCALRFLSRAGVLTNSHAVGIEKSAHRDVRLRAAFAYMRLSWLP